MRSLLDLVKEMRQAPPKKSDDPRFDELEAMADSMSGEEAAEGEEDYMSGIEDGEGAVEDTGEAMGEDEGIPDDSEDVRMMDEELGKSGLGGGIGPEAGEPSPEEELLGKRSGNYNKAKPMAKKKPNMLMKKSSYLG